VTENVPAERVVQSQVEAFNAHDVDRFVSHYTPTSLVARVGESVRAFRGMEELRRHYGGRFEEAALHATIDRRVTLGPWVVDLETMRASDATFEQLAVYAVVDGKIERAVVVPPIGRP
jgi:hypothetical protein